jgi:uncharacterized protein YbjT (DUF2867 family)
MGTRKFLITGATGVTGGYAIDALLAQNAHVRAFVRTDDDRAAKLRSRGVEVAVGDISNVHDLATALKGISAAYFVFPTDGGVARATGYFAAAAGEAGVEAIVNMSQISARRDAKSHAAQDHWLSELILNWAGIPVTHLRPTFFSEWLTYKAQLESIAQHNALRLPFGDARHAPIAGEDQGRVIAAILLNPVPHASQTYPLFGPVEMNYTEIAAEVSKALGREICYQPLDPSAFAERLKQNPRITPAWAQHLMSVAEDYRNGIFAGTNDIVERLTGRKPMTVSAFLQANRAAFGA